MFADFHEVFPDLWIRSVEFGHLPLVRERAICRTDALVFRANNRKPQVVKPILVFGTFAIASDIVEREEVPAAMVEDPVDDYTYAARMGLGDEFMEILVGAHVGGDIEVVQDVILVIFSRCEYRIDIETGKSQVCDIV